MIARGYKKGVAFDLELEPITETHYLETSVARAYLEMAAAALADGLTLIVNTAFRDVGHQVRLWNTYQRRLKAWEELPVSDRELAPRPAPAARPGYSNHQSGEAVDLNRSHDGGKTDTWLAANAGRFGFRRTVPGEPWHYERRSDPPEPGGRLRGVG